MKSFFKSKWIFFIAATVLAVCIAGFTAGAVISAKSNSYSFRKQTEYGNMAVVHFSAADGLTIYTSDAERCEFFAENGAVYPYTRASDDALRGSDALYLTGTFDNSAAVFYVRETDAEARSLKITVNAVDEAEFFAGITADRDAVSLVSLAVTDGEAIYWRALDTIGENEKTIEIYYEDCPYDEVLGAYVIVLRADEGMTRFDKLTLEGLSLAELEACRYTLHYRGNELWHGEPDGEGFFADGSVHINAIRLREIMESELIYEASTDFSVFTQLFVRLIDFIASVLSFFSIYEG